jgi:hypothetical protein
VTRYNTFRLAVFWFGMATPSFVTGKVWWGMVGPVEVSSGMFKYGMAKPLKKRVRSG